MPYPEAHLKPWRFISIQIFTFDGRQTWMARVGLSNHIGCESTNGGDGDVVGWVEGEVGHGVKKEKAAALSNQ